MAYSVHFAEDVDVSAELRTRAFQTLADISETLESIPSSSAFWSAANSGLAELNLGGWKFEYRILRRESPHPRRCGAAARRRAARLATRQHGGSGSMTERPGAMRLKVYLYELITPFRCVARTPRRLTQRLQISTGTDTPTILIALSSRSRGRRVTFFAVSDLRRPLEREESAMRIVGVSVPVLICSLCVSRLGVRATHRNGVISS